MEEKLTAAACPVPEEQIPINEYRELASSWFFRWGGLEVGAFVRVAFWIWLASWAIAGPIAAVSFSPAKQIVRFLLCGAAGAEFLLLLPLLQLYVGWQYVKGRLCNARVDYEESGWYDGQSWTKTPDILARDRLVVVYQIEPVLHRIRRAFIALGVLFSLGVLCWNVLPIFSPR